MIFEHNLPNGLKVLILEEHAVPVVAVNVWYRVGSHFEQVGTRGMAHLLEHMMFRGSEHYGPEEHANLIKETGGDPNAGTTEDFTTYHERLPAGALELALKLEAERMHLLKLDQPNFSTELNVVKEEFRMYQNGPVGDIMLKLPPILYPPSPTAPHPYSWTAVGVFADLDTGITLEKCRDFYRSYYAPNNAVLVVVGDAPKASVIKLAEQYFGSIPASTLPPEPDLALPPQHGLRRFKDRVRLPVPATGIGFRIPGARHADIIPLQVLSAILSGGESSRLHRTLVREKELAVGALGLPLVHQGPGYFFYAGIHLPNVASGKIEQAFWIEVNRLKTEEVTDDELLKARNQLQASKVFERYSAQSLAQAIGYAEVVEGDYHLYEREVKEFSKVTKADVVRVAREYFTEGNATIVSFQPKNPNVLVWLYGTIRSLFSRR